MQIIGCLLRSHADIEVLGREFGGLRRRVRGIARWCFSSGFWPGTVPFSLLANWIRPNLRLSASQARDGRGGTPLHKAAGTVNALGVRELIFMGANVNALNERQQSPVDVVSVANTALKKVIQEAGGTHSPTWDGVSGRRKDAPHTRRQHQGASVARQDRAATWREVQRSGSQPDTGAGKGEGRGCGSQPDTGCGKGKGRGCGSQPDKGSGKGGSWSSSSWGGWWHA